MEKNAAPCLPLCERLHSSDGKHLIGVSFKRLLAKRPDALKLVHTIVHRMPLPITEENIVKAEAWLKKKMDELPVDKATQT
jgi:hypothetical protein